MNDRRRSATWGALASAAFLALAPVASADHAPWGPGSAGDPRFYEEYCKSPDDPMATCPPRTYHPPEPEPTSWFTQYAWIFFALMGVGFAIVGLFGGRRKAP